MNDKVSKTGLPLCPTCERLKSQHTNPIAHRFGETRESAKARRILPTPRPPVSK